jgi:hypothetical protein
VPISGGAGSEEGRVAIVTRVILTFILVIAIVGGPVPFAFLIFAMIYGPGLFVCIIVFLVPMDIILDNRSIPWANFFVAPLLGWLIPFGLARMVSNPPEYDRMLVTLHQFGYVCAGAWIVLYWVFYPFKKQPDLD